ncbi:MAG TPA: response regulator transcription factor [Gemmatimonas sp.]|nr:response regulator transcription factor [Gemmatimonas sp.]
MPQPRILVVEDDRTTADLVALYLRHAGYDVSTERTGDGALERVSRESFDLLVLDVMLPGVDGLAICRAVRAANGPPVILLTARVLEDDRVAGFDSGADDYVPKPFSPRELVARVAAVLRRVPPGAHRELTAGPVRVHLSTRAVTAHGRDVELTSTEFALLVALIRRPGHVFTRAQLLAVLPGESSNALDRTVDVHMRNLRRKLELDPSAPALLQTVVGAGYRFMGP